MPSRRNATGKKNKKNKLAESRSGVNVTKKNPKVTSTRRKTQTKKSSLSSVPKDFGTVTPYLVIDGAARAMEFYKKAFGAKELQRTAAPDGKLIHGRIKVGNSIVLMSDEFPGAEARSPSSIGTTTVTLHIYTDDVDKLWEQALAAGARIALPIDNTFWGERYGQLVDPFGHRWSISMQIKMDPKEMEAKRKAAMEMFSQRSSETLSSGEVMEEKPAAAGVG